MLDWLRQQLLFDPRIPTPLGWGVCQLGFYHFQFLQQLIKKTGRVRLYSDPKSVTRAKIFGGRWGIQRDKMTQY